MSDAYQLRPWTDVVRPHPDVESGDLAMGTYAANLAAVKFGGGGPAVYAEAREFFAATYFTATMTKLLADVFGVLAGSPGDRVVQLRTPFGGGKTHTLLALYHLANDRVAAVDTPELADIADPGAVRVVVLSGEFLDPQRGRTVDGRSIRTLWGELAYQIGGWEAYDEIAPGGEEGVPPGGEVLGRLLGGAPTLLLLDEVLIYIATGRAVRVGDSTLGAQAMIFLMHLTETVNQQKQAAMVYSLQASVGEAVGEEGLLADLEKIAGRIDSRREPVTGDEVLKVVQRRLFQEAGSHDVRREVADTYAAMLRVHLEASAETDDTRREAAVLADGLERRIMDSYPFHPELIDLMYHRWGSLPSYQRTRGALQFLATVVHKLWVARGERAPQALIGPGDVDLSDEATRMTFLEQVGETSQYSSVIEADFLASDAGTRRVDDRMGREAPAFARLHVGSRVATTIMLLSFGAKEGVERGALEREIIEASLVPGVDGNVVRGVLRDLNEEALLYLHHTGGRYRFEATPNINNYIRSEQERFSTEEVLAGVRSALERAIGGSSRSAEITIWPNGSEQVPDDGKRFKLIYLPPEWVEERSPLAAMVLKHGSAPRAYRNALAFVVPESSTFDTARQATRTMLACESLVARASKIGLAEEQKEELRGRAQAASRNLTTLVNQSYSRVAVPAGLVEGKLEDVEFDTIDLGTVLGGGRPIHERVHDALANHVFDRLRPARLAELAKLTDRGFAWCEELADDVYRYFEMPKLWSPDALRAAIAEGVELGAFGYAVGASADGDELKVEAPTQVRLRDPLDQALVDLGAGCAVLSVTLADSLRLPAMPQDESETGVTPSGGESTDTEEPTTQTTRPAGGRHLRLHVDATEADIHALNVALSHLRDLATPGHLVIELDVDAAAEDPIAKVRLQQLVLECLEEPGVPHTVEWVD